MILVADNFQIPHPVINHAVKHRLAGPIQDLIGQYERAGAKAIDINTGPLTREGTEKMPFLVETIQEATSLPIFLDTTNPDAIRAGLASSKKTAMINGFSLEPHKLDQILPLAKEFDVDIIGYLLRPDGHVPADATQRLSIAVELYHQAISIGIAPCRLIIDPVVAPLSRFIFPPTEPSVRISLSAFAVPERSFLLKRLRILPLLQRFAG